MSEPNHTTADQLDSMLTEGKISESDYERLREALDSGADLGGGNPPGLSPSVGQASRNIPPVLWVGLVSLGLISAIQFVYGASISSLPLVIAAAVSVGLVIGLYLGHKWAYVLIILFSVAGVLVTMARNPNLAVGVLLLNALVLVPVLISTRYFFPPTHSEMGENEV